MNEEQIKRYFDWAATSPADKEIIQNSIAETIDIWGNPSSLHTAGKEALKILEEARNKCAKILNLPAETLYFTSGGTESNHIPMLSILNRPQKGEILFSSIEHPSVREMALELKKTGWAVKQIPCGNDGIIRVETLEELINTQTVLVCIMAVNNETGAIQPIYKIADTITKLSKGRNIKLHVDCVQAAGKIPLKLSYKGISSASISAHKISGPKGSGLLYIADNIEPFLKGGGQEKGLRSGTENIFAAQALSKCLEKYYISDKNTENYSRFEMQEKYTKKFIEELLKIKGAKIIPENRINETKNYSPWIIQAAFNPIPGQVMVRALDEAGFYISTGSACSMRKNNRPVLQAMNIDKTISENALRFSFGHTTTEEDIKALLDAVKKIVKSFI